MLEATEALKYSNNVGESASIALWFVKYKLPVSEICEVLYEFIPKNAVLWIDVSGNTSCPELLNAKFADPEPVARITPMISLNTIELEALWRLIVPFEYPLSDLMVIASLYCQPPFVAIFISFGSLLFQTEAEELYANIWLFTGPVKSTSSRRKRLVPTEADAPISNQ